MNIDAAEKLSILMMQIISELNDSVAFVRDNGTEEEFQSYRRNVGKVMGEITLELSNPLYEEHPSLLPEPLGGPYKVDLKIYEPRFYKW